MRGTTIFVAASFFLPILAGPIPVQDSVALSSNIGKSVDVDADASYANPRGLVERAPIIEAIPVESQSELNHEDDVEGELEEEEVSTEEADLESEKRGVRPGGGTRPTVRAVRPGGGTRITPKAVRPGGGTRPTPRAVRPGGGTRITPRAVRPGGGTRITPKGVRPGGGTRPTVRAVRPGGGTRITPKAVRPGGGA